MRARLRMSQEGADLIRRFRRQDVLELAGLLFNLTLAVHREAVGKQPLCQPVPPNNAASTQAPPRR